MLRLAGYLALASGMLSLIALLLFHFLVKGSGHDLPAKPTLSLGGLAVAGAIVVYITEYRARKAARETAAESDDSSQPDSEPPKPSE